MTIHRPRALAALLATSAALALAAPATAKELTVALTADASHMDPQAGEELSSNIMFYHLYDPLVRRSAGLEFEPGLAESWELVDDTTWRFHLRPGVKFHDGSELKASDVTFTLARLKDSLMSNLGRQHRELQRPRRPHGRDRHAQALRRAAQRPRRRADPVGGARERGRRRHARAAADGHRPLPPARVDPRGPDRARRLRGVLAGRAPRSTRSRSAPSPTPRPAPPRC